MVENVNDGVWTFRPRSSKVYLTLAALFLIGWLWSAFDQGATMVRTIPWVVALGTACWMVWGRPQVRIDSEAIMLVNPVRTVRIGWNALIHVTTQYTLTLHTPRGKYGAWAAPGPGRHVASASNAAEVRAAARAGRRAGPVAIGDLPGAPSGIVAREVRTRWDRLIAQDRIAAGTADLTDEQITVAWGPVATLGVSLALGVATALLA